MEYDPNIIIDRLGGTSTVAELCDLRPPSISNWRTAGIPKGWIKFFRSIRPDVFANAPLIELDKKSKRVQTKS